MLADELEARRYVPSRQPLLHGASSTEVRLLQITDIDPAAQTVRLGKRPHSIPLDPASWTVLQRCLAAARHGRRPTRT
ncbi:hypothetical protein [Streptomyces sp. KR55]|uniref:hypothetical protein n=1 Tax=Streptomyces sp. KR55 TaxID=3457425 RepID=UPI003FD22401